MDPNLTDGSSSEPTSQLLMQMMNQMAEQIRNLRAEREADRDATRDQIRSLQESLTSSRPTPPDTESECRPEPLNELDRLLDAPTRKTRPTLPDPPKFEGIRSKFRAWLSEMRNKLRVDGRVIGSKADQGCSSANDNRVRRAGGRGGDSDPDQYLQYLEECYGDPNARTRALENLRSLRQGDKESFAALLPRFEKELADSGGATWPEEVKISYLEGALRQDLRLATVYAAPTRTTYAEWVQALQSLSSGLECVGRRDALRSGGGNCDSRGRDSDGDTKMTGVNRIGQESKKRRKAGATLKNERRCYRCGRTDHVIVNCPAKVVFPSEVRKDRPTTARVQQPDSEDSESAGTSSENEEPVGKD
ncbi:hypothetical protein HIM_11050 [Hirsutella minnesotensis 3608]|uniref:CCHC-type domain-containing protein n=1 Tax=Hirsutella minnesotensis 3608 TaxID=1043627 RepID=A0A0F7ZWU0_9HYPO|nr:hypothetical protein HIM_11050 [Hirsutella minnesotensis 3608]